MTHRSTDAVDVLRAMWAAEGQGSADLDEACGPQKSCKNMVGVSFDGMAEPGTDLRAAWRDRLQRGLRCSSQRDVNRVPGRVRLMLRHVVVPQPQREVDRIDVLERRCEEREMGREIYRGNG